MPMMLITIAPTVDFLIKNELFVPKWLSLLDRVYCLEFIFKIKLFAEHPIKYG